MTMIVVVEKGDTDALSLLLSSSSLALSSSIAEFDIVLDNDGENNDYDEEKVRIVQESQIGD